MTTNIIPFDMNNPIAPIANMADIVGQGNIGSAGETVPTLSIKGKIFTLVKGNESKQVTIDTPEGRVASPSMRVVILGYTPGRTRTYFEGKFDPENTKAPDCASYDGIYPSTDIENPVSATCNGCPYSVKGSDHDNNGKPTVKCKQGKFLAVVPVNNLNHEVYRVKLPITSVYDPGNPEEPQGWFGYDQYIKFLQARNINASYGVETTMKFDINKTHPKLLFKATGMLGEESLREAHAIAQKDDVKHILGLDKCRSEAPAISAPAPVVEAAPQPVAQPATPAPVVQETAQVAPAPVVEAAPQPVVEAPTPAPQPAPVVVETDDALEKAFADW